MRWSATYEEEVFGGLFVTSIFVRRLAASALALFAAANTVQAQDFTAEFNRQWGLRMIGVDEVMTQRWNGAGVMVGVLDTGLETSPFHPEFAGRLNGLMFDGFWGMPYLDSDDSGHGTHVAGTIAANRDGYGMVGVASGSTVVPLRILADGSPGTVSGVDVLRGSVRYGLANNVRIFNASFGAYSGYNFEYDPVGRARTYFNRDQLIAKSAAELGVYREVVQAGGVMVFANGNWGDHDPAQFPLSVQAAAPYYFPELERGWLAVTSVGPTNLAVYSQICSVGMMWCLSAPGGDHSVGTSVPGTGDGGILAPYPTSLNPDPSEGVREGYIDGRRFASFEGTSMAAPHVSGALAIAKQLYPNASYQDLRTLILQTATDIGAAGIDPVYGWGLLNVRNIVDAASPLAGTVYAQQSWARQGVVNHLIDGLNPNAAVERGGDWGYWAMPLEVSGTINNANPALSASLGAAGLTAGVEGGIAPDWYVKVFGAVSQSTIGANGNSASDTGLHLGGQVVYESQALFGDLTLGGSLFAGSVSRGAAPGMGGVIAGSIGQSGMLDWAQWSAIRLGHHFEIGEAGVLSPYAFGRLVHQNLSPFSETGSILALSGAAATSLVGELGVGLKWEGPSVEAGPLDITPVLDVAYSQQSGTDTRAFSLLGNGTTASSGAQSGGTLQVSTALEMTSDQSPFDLKLGYTAQVQSSTLVHSVGLKLMGSF
ncbi:S8 family peptidase [Devosia rhizoryzae]|uniref:S8 family serine peptidase n=1 Tax=Devosia rhizoryzae TaxID=2774137 RepID=A0ABX7C7N6_9HYPH|nr:S8 family serine peptidase [Devosia rhizoryzae]QQR40278.1 S8 family serine peptidase [Devosia rhizoryzae]